MRKLKFPTYDYIKSLPTKYTKEDYCREYEWDLFYTPASVYGRLSYNEDYSNYIYFDVMEDGHCNQNYLGMALKFNKANYEKICKHAQKVFESFYEALDEDCSKYWENYERVDKIRKNN